MIAAPGTYALILQSHRTTDVQIGHWGRLHVEPGYYIYIGSAFGPGGVRSRVTRHFRQGKRCHWHIDYLREVTDPVGAWCCYAPVRLEHRWAQALGQRVDIRCIKGFGCSDCNCESHLFTTSTVPDGDAFFAAPGDAVELWSYRPVT